VPGGSRASLANGQGFATGVDAGLPCFAHRAFQQTYSTLCAEFGFVSIVAAFALATITSAGRFTRPAEHAEILRTGQHGRASHDPFAFGYDGLPHPGLTAAGAHLKNNS
jgi:hypothetical protein